MERRFKPSFSFVKIFPRIDLIYLVNLSKLKSKKVFSGLSVMTNLSRNAPVKLANQSVATEFV